VLPAGILRENPSALRRAGVFLLTRCQEPLPADPPCLYGGVLHSRHILAKTAVSLEGTEVSLKELAGKRGGAFAGIAHPERFYSDLERAGLTLTARVSFPDHVPYGEAQLARLREMSADVDYLIMTEKDGGKLHGCRFSVPCYQAPMTLQVIEDEELKRRVLAVVNRGDLQ
jgi:tetraacyldisaccharide 4'-kinase